MKVQIEIIDHCQFVYRGVTVFIAANAYDEFDAYTQYEFTLPGIRQEQCEDRLDAVFRTIDAHLDGNRTP